LCPIVARDVALGHKIEKGGFGVGETSFATPYNYGRTQRTRREKQVSLASLQCVLSSSIGRGAKACESEYVSKIGRVKIFHGGRVATRPYKRHVSEKVGSIICQR